MVATTLRAFILCVYLVAVARALPVRGLQYITESRVTTKAPDISSNVQHTIKNPNKHSRSARDTAAVSSGLDGSMDAKFSNRQNLTPSFKHDHNAGVEGSSAPKRINAVIRATGKEVKINVRRIDGGDGVDSSCVHDDNRRSGTYALHCKGSDFEILVDQTPQGRKIE